MPNKLSIDKRRLSLAEHVVVIEALKEIADTENKTVADVMREALRSHVAHKVGADEALRQRARRRSFAHTSGRVLHARSSEDVVTIKEYNRVFDRTLIETGISAAEEIQHKNSMIPAGARPRIIRLVS